MAEYHTQQRAELIAFLTRHGGRQLTVAEIVEGLREENPASGAAKSTVYRLITKLVEENTVKRFVKGHSRQFAYQLVMGEPCRRHLHLKCVNCGQLEHLDDALSLKISNEVLSDTDFALDRGETVLYGRCRECREKQKKTEE